MPLILLWMYSLLGHLNSNRIAFMTPFNPHDNKGDALAYNKIVYESEKSDRSREAKLESYFDMGRLACMKATMAILWILDHAGATRKFMTEKEIEMGYDAKVFMPFKDCFFVKKYSYQEAKDEIQKQVTALGETVGRGLCRKVRRF